MTEPIPCRRCQCTTWHLLETQLTTVDTVIETTLQSEVRSWVYRCASCGVKANIQEVASLNAMLGQPKGVQDTTTEEET